VREQVSCPHKIRGKITFLNTLIFTALDSGYKDRI
jgi:hypothetical protein